MMKDQSVLITGSIALDTIETAKGRKENMLGGSVTYAMIAAGLTARVHVVGIVGDDFPQDGLDIYQQHASNLDDLKVEKGNTFRWGGRYYENMDHRDTLFTDLGVFSEFKPQLSEINKQVPLLFLANIHPDLQLSVIDQSEGKQTVVVDTMNLWIETTSSELQRVLEKSDVLLINETESGQLTGKNSPDDSARKIQSLGPQTIIIKLGSKGALLYDCGKKIKIKAYPVRELVDPTGAGDTFGGGVMSVLSSGGSYTDALINGSALASICVEGFGIEALLNCTREEIEKRREYLRATVSS